MSFPVSAPDEPSRGEETHCVSTSIDGSSTGVLGFRFLICSVPSANFRLILRFLFVSKTSAMDERVVGSVVREGLAASALGVKTGGGNRCFSREERSS